MKTKTTVFTYVLEKPRLIDKVIAILAKVKAFDLTGHWKIVNNDDELVGYFLEARGRSWLVDLLSKLSDTKGGRPYDVYAGKYLDE